MARICLFTAWVSTQAFALQIDSEQLKNDAIYGIEFPEGSRAFYGHANRVQSISVQDYLTASFRVTELNIVNEGSALLRIYYSRPLKPGELQKALADGAQAGGMPGASSIQESPVPPQVQAMADRARGVSEAVTGTAVLKEYPSATHAHTIEYRVSSSGELLALHAALVDHWAQKEEAAEDGDAGSGDDAAERLQLGGTVFTVE
ncbi:MAG: hypothetical protein GVY36_03610 [Verrucomicrobia bacterium]|nr:hypothetical protein [Verrucomicrobiota bacterium]